jgi:hypothetical protein
VRWSPRVIPRESECKQEMTKLGVPRKRKDRVKEPESTVHMREERI